jgi:hypothetical protein
MRPDRYHYLKLTRSNRNDTRIVNPHSTPNRKTIKEILSAWPLLCHNEIYGKMNLDTWDGMKWQD